MGDIAEQLVTQVVEARHAGQRLSITGHGSKPYWRPFDLSSETGQLTTTGHCGVVDYEPGDMVITVRAGTSLTEVESVLAAQRQALGFEPPRFGGAGRAQSGTIGGAIACGLSGPRRPWSGAARDFVLGVEMVNGLGERLRFGGQLIKNVAGFDVPRLLAGSWGSLGLLLELSLRVVPVRPRQLTLQLEMPAEQALQTMVGWQRKPLPISALVYHQGLLSVRLSGTETGVSAAQQIIGGQVLAADHLWWDGLRDQQWPFFQQQGPMWRFSMATASELARFGGEDHHWLIDWGGAQRWYRGSASDQQLQEYARRTGGWLSCFGAGIPAGHIGEGAVSKEAGITTDPSRNIQARIQNAFDPDGLFVSVDSLSERS